MARSAGRPLPALRIAVLASATGRPTLCGPQDALGPRAHRPPKRRGTGPIQRARRIGALRARLRTLEAPSSSAALDALVCRLQATAHTTQDTAAGLAHSGRSEAAGRRLTGRRVHGLLASARRGFDDTDTAGRPTPGSTQPARTKHTIMDAHALDCDHDAAYGDARLPRRRTGPLSSPAPAVDGAGRASPRAARGRIARTRTTQSRVALCFSHVRTELAPSEPSTTATRATRLPATSAPGMPRTTAPTTRPER